MFVWGAFSHMVLLIGVGFNRLPDEDAVIEKLRNSVPKEGLYFFPIIDFRGNPRPEQRADWEAKFRAGPTGLLLYHPTGGTPLSQKNLLTQFLSNLRSAGIAAYIVFLVLAPYWQRVSAITLFGVFAWLSISAIYWIGMVFPPVSSLPKELTRPSAGCLRVSRWPNSFRRLRELPPDMMVEPRGYRLA